MRKINFSDNLLLMNRNSTNFCMLILYPATLLMLLIRSSNFLVEYLGVYIYKVMSSANRDNFTSFFPILMPFIYFSCLIAVARTSNTILNKSCKSGRFCLIPNPRGKANSFSPLSMMLAVGLSYVAFTMLRYVPFIPTLLRDFIINGC